MSIESAPARIAGYTPERLGKRTASLLAVLAVWWGLTAVGYPTLPTPTEVASSFASLLATGGYWDAVILSASRVYAAFLAATVLAVPLGLLMGWSRRAFDLLFPSFEMVRPIPPIAWLPATILIMPTLQVWLVVATLEVETNILFITFLGAFFPVLLNTIDGMNDTEIEYPRAAESLGAGRWQTFRHVYLPSSLPSIHTGMVVGMGLAWVNLVAAEMLAGAGLGYLTWSAYTAGNYPKIVVGMISIGVLGYGSSGLLRLLGDRALAWQGESGG